MNKRNYYTDNLKAFLIFLVVLGHVYEYVSFAGINTLYIVIYTFHMPAFTFISGLYFKKTDNNSIFKNLLYPYLIFQVAYILLTSFLAKNPIRIQFTTPEWIMWYLFAMFLWYCVSNIISLNSKKQGAVILIISVIIALISGFDQTVGHYFSLSRAIVFFPFFFAGVYIRKFYFDKFEQLVFKPTKTVKALLTILVITYAITIFLLRSKFKVEWFYQSYPYQHRYGILIRLATIIFAAIFILFMFIFIPKSKCTLITYIGQNTMPIYLLHGFIVLIFSNKMLLSKLPLPIISTAILSALIVIVLSSPPVVKVVKPFLKYPFYKNKDNR